MKNHHFSFFHLLTSAAKKNESLHSIFQSGRIHSVLEVGPEFPEVLPFLLENYSIGRLLGIDAGLEQGLTAKYCIEYDLPNAANFHSAYQLLRKMDNVDKDYLRKLNLYWGDRIDYKFDQFAWPYLRNNAEKFSFIIASNSLHFIDHEFVFRKNLQVLRNSLSAPNYFYFRFKEFPAGIEVPLSLGEKLEIFQDVFEGFNYKEHWQPQIRDSREGRAVELWNF